MCVCVCVCVWIPGASMLVSNGKFINKQGRGISEVKGLSITSAIHSVLHLPTCSTITWFIHDTM